MAINGCEECRHLMRMSDRGMSECNVLYRLLWGLLGAGVCVLRASLSVIAALRCYIAMQFLHIVLNEFDII